MNNSLDVKLSDTIAQYKRYRIKPLVCPWSSIFISYLDDGMESVRITFVSTADMLEDKVRIQNGLE